MKKIFYKIGVMLTMAIVLTNYVKAQLPLQYGDMVVSFKYGMVSNTTSASTVLAILRTSNTSTANPGEVWTLPSYSSGSQTKPAWYSNTSWTQTNLGDIFGITIDNYGNIYVSSTQIYGSNASPKVYEIDAVTGNITTITFPAFTGSFGNIKFEKIGNDGYLYVSDWGNGLIHRLKRSGDLNSNLWSYANSFNPEFGRTTNHLINNDNAHGQLPYGLAIRTTASGKALYYSKIGKSFGRNLGSPTGNITGMVSSFSNEIWSVPLTSTGDFNTPSEQLQTVAANTFQYDNPIADIAFSGNGKRMLLGQQSLHALTTLDAHLSEDVELVESTPNSWISSGHQFPAGNYLNAGGTYVAVHQSNAVGGVSYSNNVLYGNAGNFACDTTIWVVSDAISIAGLIPIVPTNCTMTYGVMGFTSNGVIPYSTGFPTYQNSLIIDEDDEYGSMDKYHLGDVEVYKKPLNCAPVCACGSWLSTPTLNDILIPSVPIKKHSFDDMQKNKTPLALINPGPIGPVPVIVNYPIQFVQGNVSGLINAIYQCTGNCGTKYTWSITNDATSAVVTSGTTLPVDLALYNSLLQCGNYTLHIMAGCGNTKCGGLTIPISIICEPPSCCKASIDIDLYQSSVNAITNTANPNAFSSADFTYNINFSLPMSEVRVSVEEFKLVTNSPNCLNCNNRPATWGNILSASLNGIPMTLSGMTSVPTGSLAADYREAVYNTGTPLPAPGVGLSIRLSLPAITELSCCEVSAYICLKFTFKDTQCRECVQMACSDIKLIAPAVINTGGKKIDKIEIKKFNVIH